MRGNARQGAAAAALLLALGAWAPARAEFEGNVNLFAGGKMLKEEDWAPVDRQPEIGVHFAFGEIRSPIHFALDMFASRDDATAPSPLGGTARTEADLREYSLGVRKVFRRGKMFHPHIGGGGQLTKASVDVTGSGGPTHLNDTAFGWWVDTGATWRLVRHLNLGFEIRFSGAKLALGSLQAPIEEIHGGGVHAGALVGYGW